MLAGLVVVAAQLAVQLSLTAAVVARHRAERAADAAALAAAIPPAAQDAGCARARRVAAANRADLVRCTLVAGTADVVVHVAAPRWPLPLPGTAAGHARAGPGSG
jgi:secretion/DNA translocation related TadE-like protein